MASHLFKQYQPGSKLHLDSAQSGAFQYESVRYVPQEGIPAGGFTAGSQLNFSWRNSGTRCWIPHASYLSVRIRAGAAGGVLPTTNKVSFVPIAPAALFSDCTLSCNGKQIENVAAGNLAPQAMYCFRTMETEDQQREGALCGYSLDPASFDLSDLTAAVAAIPNPPAQAAAYGAAVTSTGGLSFLSFPQTQPTSSRRQDVRATQINRYVWRPPLAVWSIKDPMPSADWSLRLGIDNNFFARVCQSTDGTDITTALATLASANNDHGCYLEITSIELHCAFVDLGDAGRITNANLQYDLTMVQTVAPSNALTANQIDDVTIKVPASSIRHTLAFMENGARLGAANASNACTMFYPTAAFGLAAKTGVTPAPDPASNANTNALLNVSGLQLQYAGHTGPQQIRRLYYNSVEITMRQAYNDWAMASGLKNPESYRVWLNRGPLFSFSEVNVRNPDDRDTSLQVHVERDAPGSSQTLICFSEYEAALVLQVVNGEVVDSSVIER